MNELDDIVAAQTHSVNPLNAMIDAVGRAPKSLNMSRFDIAIGEYRLQFQATGDNAWMQAAFGYVRALEDYGSFDLSHLKTQINAWQTNYKPTPEQLPPFAVVDDCDEHEAAGPVAVTTAGCLQQPMYGLYGPDCERKDRGDWFDPIPKEE